MPKELTITTPEPQRRYDNMLYNEAYFMMIDQCGNGYGNHMSGDGYLNNVVAHERIIYIRDNDSGEFFSIGVNPVFKKYESFKCTQGLNYQIIENVTAGIKAVWRIFVPTGNDPVEIWDVKIETSENRNLSLFTLLEMPIQGVDTYGGPIYRLAKFYPEIDGIFVRGDAQKFEEIDFPLHNGFITSNKKPVAWDAGYDAFIGLHKHTDSPIALEKGKCSNSFASVIKTNGGLQFDFSTSADKDFEIRFIVGACENLDTIKSFKEKYLSGSLKDCSIFEKLKKDRKEKSKKIQADTPCKTINNMLNDWAVQQAHYLATWCRWGYKGYRDIVQMSQGVLYWDTALAKKNLREALAHQYNDGFALRGWNPVDPLRYADCASWNISAITEYIKETGDFDFLNEIIPYFDEGEATVYQHLMQIMIRLHEDRGEHGLCLAFFGDWNDSLTGVCRKGKGETVWLSMAFCKCALIMKELAEFLEKNDDAALMQKWHKEMADNINKFAWDGEWYLCALDDDGNPIGSSKNEEGKIFLNMQSWAQLGKICDDEKWEAANKAVYKYLDSGWGLSLNWPTYTKPTPNVGRLSYLRPGICENGSVYSHGNAFYMLAFLERGDADAALKVWEDIHPANPNRPIANQPNVFANGYYGPDHDYAPGMSEHIWTTGSASWLVPAVVENMIGLRRTYEGIVIKPCLPSDWKEVKISREFRGTKYNVTINNSSPLKGVDARPGDCPPLKGVDRKRRGDVKSMLVDGKDFDFTKPLPIDNAEHEIDVTLN